VTIVEVADRLLPGEAPWVGAMVADVLRHNGIDLHLGTQVERVEAVDGGRALRVVRSGGPDLEADRLLLAGGRRPSSADLGLDTVDGRVEESGAVTIDARGRVVDRAGAPVDGLYAVGDLTGVSSYTHSANYQARIVADDIVGNGHDADYVGVPRAVYLDPAVFCVGLTPEQAGEQDVAIRTATVDLSGIERAALVEGLPTPHGPQPVRGRLELVVAAGSGVLLGASCVGPEADSWGGELALAVRARLDVGLMAEHVRAFPTWSEAISAAAAQLAHE
jgi:dihydrolipoamide dehydrogenase